MSKLNVETLTPTPDCPVSEGQHRNAFLMAFFDQAALETWKALNGESAWFTEEIFDALSAQPDERTAVDDAAAHARRHGFTDFWFDEIPLEVIRRLRIIRKPEHA